MHRNGNKQINEIDAKINDIYYNKQGEMSFTSNNSDIMASNFGYNNPGKKGDAPSRASLQQHVDYINTKIECLNIHY